MSELDLQFHPAKESPGKAAVLAFVLGITLQALWNWLTPAVALVLWLVLLVSLRDFFLETRYTLSADGLRVEGQARASRSYPWQRFRAFVEDRNGLFLTPYQARRATESQRGLFLPLTPEQRRQSVAFCLEQGLTRRAR